MRNRLRDKEQAKGILEFPTVESNQEVDQKCHEDGSKNSKTPRVVKNSYINGIKELIEEDNYHSGDPLLQRGLQNLDKEKGNNIPLQKLKNRESAKNSRKRRKIYIELLEKKVKEQEKEIQKLREQLEIIKSKSTVFDPYQTSLAQKIAQARYITEKGPNSFLKNECEQFEKLFGISGYERIENISQLFSKVEENMVPNYVRYLIRSAEKGVELFSKDQDEAIQALGGFFRINRITENQVMELSNYKRTLVDLGSMMKTWSQDLKFVITKYSALCSKLQESFKGLRAIFQPEQLLRLYIRLDDPGLELSPDIPLWDCVGEIQTSRRSSDDFNSITLGKRMFDNSGSETSSLILPSFKGQATQGQLFEIKTDDPLFQLLN